MNLWTVRVGDEIAVETNDHSFYLTKVTKVTAKLIHTHSSKYEILTGKPATRHSVGKGVTNDPKVINELEKIRDEKKRKADDIEQAIQARNARETYQLATQIVDSVEPSKSIQKLELLGARRLKEIIAELRRL
jgi:hypothetical protein